MRNFTIGYNSVVTAKPGYRPDIDGLRAVAVLAVMWFHSGLPGTPGGFVGVDIFFVISGYLITRIIRDDLAADNFSFGHFYRRRFRRIAPALVVVVLATLIAGCFLLVPDNLTMLGQSALAALGMVPNIYFWGLGAGDYFAIAKRAPPQLLHLWSLGVEEQFYLLFPLFLAAATRVRAARAAVVAVAVLSFAVCVIGSSMAPTTVFYLLPGRAWELALGTLLALDVVRIPARWRWAASVAGAAMVAAGIVLLSGQDESPLWAVSLPAIGATLVIGSGSDAPANRILALAPFVWVGRISYSLYLWHWPIFSYLAYATMQRDLPVGWALAGMALSVALAWLTYLLVEQPARRPSTGFGKVVVMVSAAAAVAATGALVALATRGLPARFDARSREMMAQTKDRAPLAIACTDTPIVDVERRCVIGRGAPTAAIWGDSHASSDSAGIAMAIGAPTILFSSGGCPPVFGQIDGAVDGCAVRNRAIFDWLRQHPQVRTIVFVARWNGYARAGNRDQVWRNVQAAVDALDGRRIVVVAGEPNPNMDVPNDSAMLEHWGRPPLRLTCPQARVPLRGVVIADLSAAFCAYPEPWRLFVDRNHPSMTANRAVIAPALAAIMKGSKQ